MDVQTTALQTRARNLGITDDGYLQLEATAKEWATRKHVIGFDQLKFATGWIVPRGVDQSFSIPTDYVAVGSGLRDELIENFKNVGGGIRVLWGPPGSGKSTFLSDLYEKTRVAGIACVRHFYFVQANDPDRLHRLEFERAGEALLYELIREAGQSLPNRNPNFQELQTIVHQTAANLAAKNKTIVLIIDGLDHVVREAEEFELRSFLRQLLPARKGLWLVFGTRMIGDQRISSFLKGQIQPSDWKEVPRFGFGECRALLEANASQIKIPDHDLDEFTERFLENTQGHPLHARYTVETLKIRTKGRFALVDDLEGLPPYGKNLAEFYARLWETLTPEGKQMACLLSLAGFGLTSQYVVEILASGANAASTFFAASDSLKPYLDNGSRFVELFHASFREFVKDTAEYKASESVLLSTLEQWLTVKAPEPLRWAHLNLIRYFQGNTLPLLECINRAWLVTSIAEARPFQETIDQISWAAHAAMQRKEFGRAFLCGQLKAYTNNSRSDNEELWDRVDLLARRLRYGSSAEPESFQNDIALRSPAFLSQLALDVSQTGGPQSLRRIFEELNERLGRQRTQAANSFDREWGANAKALVVVAGLARVSVKSVLRWAMEFERIDQMQDLLKAYAETLARSRQRTDYTTILANEALTKKDIRTIRDATYRIAVFAGHTDLPLIRSRQSPWARLYSCLHGARHLPLDLPKPNDIPTVAKEYGEDDQAIADKFVWVYLESFSQGLQKRGTCQRL